MTEELKHDTPEDRIARGEQFATFDDLDGLNDETLTQVMGDCPIEPPDPDICVPCKAMMILEDRYDEQMGLEDGEVIEPLLELAKQAPVGDDNGVVHYEEVPVDRAPLSTASLLDQFAAKVDELNTLVLELMEGPPIPPKDVSLEELAVLLIGAKRWIQMLDGMGIELAANQQAVRDTVEAVIEKVGPRA